MSYIRISFLVLVAILSTSFTGCSFWNKIKTQQHLVDGTKSYQEKNYDEAEAHFREAIRLSPDQPLGTLFLARTLHAKYVSARIQQQAEEAIAEYKKVIPQLKEEVNRLKTQLEQSKNDEKTINNYKRVQELLSSSIAAVGNLLETLQKNDEWQAWQNQIAEDKSFPDSIRAMAYALLASKENTCANEITSDPSVRKTVKVEGKQVYEYVKPQDEKTYQRLKGCIARGKELIDKALTLDRNTDSIWSYKTSLLIQEKILAEMEGRKGDKERLEKEAESARAEFVRLAEAKRKQKEEEKAKQEAQQEASKN
jgi:tetratricopeptide (TPR) repeat protein